MKFKNFHFRYVKTGMYFLLSLALVVMLIVLAVVSGIHKVDDVENTPLNTPTPVLPTQMTEETNRVKIQLVGDVVLHNSILENNRDAHGNYIFDKCFSEIDSMIDGDVVLFNLEGVLDAYKDGTQISGAPIYNYPPAIADSLKKIGFTHCITANDRATYFADSGIKNNVENIRQNGLIPVGTSLEGEDNYSIKEYNGIKVAVLAYRDKLTDTENIDLTRIAVVDFDDIEGTVDRISADVNSVKKAGAEIVITSVHWGEEMAAKPTEKQKELAERMVKCGVDVVYGTLPHTFQPVEFQSIVTNNNESKNAVIAYSMGNFLAHPSVTTGELSQQSGILNIYVERDVNGKAYISTAECIAIYIYLVPQGENIQSAYKIIAASENALSEERPSIFINDEEWQKCKDSYENIKTIVEQSALNGMPLGIK